MKHWFTHFLLRYQLRGLKHPLSPRLKVSFPRQLKKEARELFAKEKTNPVSVFLNLLFMNHKRSLYGAFLSLVAMSVFAVSINPKTLTPEEFITHAEAVYNSGTGTIYHEKRLSERVEGGTVVEASLEELWLDNKTGTDLTLFYNPDTNEIVKGSGGSPNTGAYTTPEDPLLEEFEQQSEEQKAWAKTFWGEKNYCAAVEEKDGMVYQSVLTLAAEDPSVYTLSGSSHEKGASYFQPLFDPNSGPGILQEMVAHLQEDTDHPDLVFSEDDQGKDWYVLTETDETNNERQIRYYFDTHSFQLVKQEIRSNDDPENYERTTYLTSEYLDESVYDSIFNFESYGMLPVYDSLSAGAAEFIQESGCYKSGGEKLSNQEEKALIEQLPEGVWDRLNTQLEQIIEATESKNSEESITIWDLNPEKAGEFIQPTEGALTQTFHEGHPAIDIANKTPNTPIYAAADGIVTKTDTGWSGGSGNNIWIDHGNGYETHYAHLQEFYVQEGDTVKQGEVIGTMGNTGRVYGTTGIHLHFELSYHGTKVNPLEYFTFK